MRFFLLLLLIPYLVFSQTNTDIQSKKFDSIFYQVAVNISSANPTKALYLADSLSIYADNEQQKIKSQILFADILAKQEKKGEAINKLLEVLEIAKQEKEYAYQARIYGFLSTLYRDIGFIDKGRNFINKGMKVSDFISDNDRRLKYIALCNQELAEYAFDEKNYNRTIEYLHLANLTFEKEENLDHRNFVLATTHEMLGHSYDALEVRDSALAYFSKANIFINKAGAGSSIWASSIYHGYGKAFLKFKNIDSAGVYLKKALAISEKSENPNLKEQVFKSISEYYNQIKQLDSFTKYNIKYITQLNENTKNKKLIVNSAYNALNINSNKSDVVPKSDNYIVIFSVLAIALLIFMYLKTKKIFSNTNNKTLIIDNSKTTDIVLPKKTEEDLVEKLKEFEASNGFLDKNMSLPTLIGLLNTNTKYFRNFLKNYKNTDYTHYINNLRINYIKNKLTTDKAYLNYKISYLADECGFSSHSKFSACFKDITGYSPSEFIEDIKNSN
ncbi:helix-turn-helix domain-containing protein [Lutibacter sp. A64]|uniref:AraC family transcriptional regulator n=1 Tax=Lutibacter sp. A64 TaxID=2918526 RepID=UPI001F06DBDD|nr:AraC family transcriptional regulator [Lutibacter sp. A64]UMB53396.1 helix-turn-helix domain-containing protein [Lutibacter sp. A64]